MSQEKKAHTGGPLFFVGALIYIGFLILFCWQTILFVNWLFPSDQIEMRLLMVACFDGMSLFWSLLDLFYHFAIKATRTITRWGWGVSFLLSLIATIFYLIISSMFRFNMPLSQEQVDIGYGVTAVAVIFQVVMLTFFFYIEIVVRHPHQDEWYPLPALPEHVRVESVVEPIALTRVSTVKKKRVHKPITDQLQDDQAVSTTPLL